jgi:hypothetical protein
LNGVYDSSNLSLSGLHRSLVGAHGGVHLRSHLFLTGLHLGLYLFLKDSIISSLVSFRPPGIVLFALFL